MAAGRAARGPWQSETFDDRKQALRFQALVEAHDRRWPEGWVKGWGLGAPAGPEHTDLTPLRAFGEAYVRRLTSAGPYTQTRYLSQVALLVEWIRGATGREPLVETFTADDDRDWINARRRAGASPKTIANYHGLLAAIFKDAVRKGLVAANPCEGVRLPSKHGAAHTGDNDVDESDKVFLTEKEFALLKAAAHPDSQDLLVLAVGTGLRWGELTALRVEDLHLRGDTPHLVVRRAWKRNGSGDFALEGQGEPGWQTTVHRPRLRTQRTTAHGRTVRTRTTRRRTARTATRSRRSSAAKGSRSSPTGAAWGLRARHRR